MDEKFVCDDNMINGTVNLNVLKEKRAIYNHIKKQVFKNNGILFGGMVRDEIISEHYKKKFNEYIKTEKGKEKSSGSSSIDFWNKEYNPETNARIIVPNDMDVFFDEKKDASDFIKLINQDFPNNTIVDDIGPIKYGGPLSNYKSKKIIIKYILGKTFIFPGYKMIIKIDLIYTETPLRIEPPFNNLDMLCNAFIQTKDGNKRLSNNTGTELDSLSYVEKMTASLTIIKDIINFKTEICQIVSKTDVSYCVDRYLKMLERPNGFNWNILNLPYELVKSTDKRCRDEICCICQDEINKEEDKNTKEIAILTTVVKTETEHKIIDGSKTHHECLIKYIKVQLSKKPVEGYLKILCPYKKNINYSCCFRNVNWEKYIE
jgi:hypothetical protein